MFLQDTAQWAPSTFYEDPSGSAGTWTAPGASTTPKRRDYIAMSSDIRVPAQGVDHGIGLAVTQPDHSV
eukprot:4794899-Pyramimonas_sp.AAC.1